MKETEEKDFVVKDKAKNEPSNYVIMVNGKQEIKVHRGTIASWIKNGYKEK